MSRLIVFRTSTACPAPLPRHCYILSRVRALRSTLACRRLLVASSPQPRLCLRVAGFMSMAPAPQSSQKRERDSNIGVPEWDSDTIAVLPRRPAAPQQPSERRPL
jgi:hypothetical protein